MAIFIWILSPEDQKMVVRFCHSEGSTPTSRISLQRVWRELWCVKQKSCSVICGLKTSFLYEVCWNAKYFLSSGASSISTCLAPAQGASVLLPGSTGTAWDIGHRRNQTHQKPCDYMVMYFYWAGVLAKVINLHTRVCSSHTQQRKSTWADSMRSRAMKVKLVPGLGI